MNFASKITRRRNRRQVLKKDEVAVQRASFLAATAIALCTVCAAASDEDPRQFVNLPVKMQQHMMSNMRDHLKAINEILTSMTSGDFDRAADVAETRLGMSSLESHGASHMANFMPEGMRKAGTAMHSAASRLALKAQEGEALPAYKALSEVISACISCHSGYRIR